MEFNAIIRKARTIFGHLVIHPFVLFCTLWLNGVLVAFATNEIGLIGLDSTAIFIAYKWTYWLINSWPQLSFEAYNYLKIKLVLAIIVPEIMVGLYYIKNFKRIKALQFFLPKESV